MLAKTIASEDVPAAAELAGGTGETLRYSVGVLGGGAEELGKLLVAESERGICAITLGENAELLRAGAQRLFPRAHLHERSCGALFRRVESLLQSPRQTVELPLDIRGTQFQQRVWQVLRAIAPGAPLSYGDVAARVGLPTAVRAVASACAANRLAVVIPCHRVVRKNGDLSGYRWGVERKRWLLQREGECFRHEKAALAD